MPKLYEKYTGVILCAFTDVQGATNYRFEVQQFSGDQPVGPISRSIAMSRGLHRTDSAGA